MEEKSNVQIIKEFFDPPKVSMDELKALTKEERQDLADQIRAL